MATTDNSPIPPSTSSGQAPKRSQFFCPSCPGQDNNGAFFFFAVAPDIRVSESGDFLSACPQCGKEDCREPWYMANVRKCQGKQTGPTSQAGKDKCRMNGYFTGSSYASGAIPKSLPPAKPGRYAECEECQDLEECKTSVEEAKGTCLPVYCHRLAEVVAKYRNAHLTGDPESLRFTAAEVHAKMHRVMNQCFKAVFDNDVYIESVILSNGQPVYVKQNGCDVPLTEKKINPAINEAIKILEKMNFSLSDWTLTPKSKEAKAALEGYLAGQAAARGQDMSEFMTEHKKNMKAFHAALAEGNELGRKDEALKEVSEEEQETTEAT